MGAALAEAFAPARLVFEEVDDALGQRLSRLMFEGPGDELTLTENAQPALMAVSLAVVRVLEQEAGISLSDKAALVAGHSLGEYSALAAVGTLDLADAARLLKRRGQAMQEAVPVGEGAMAALLGLDLADATEVAAAAAAGGDQGPEICAPANDNAPGQVVISGHKTAVERAVELENHEDASTLDTLARVYYEMGELETAIEWQKKAVALESDNTSIDATLERYNWDQALALLDQTEAELGPSPALPTPAPGICDNARRLGCGPSPATGRG